ncbi:hypothetical protein GC163_11680 [bacterium]|nr:hypothetical protein [bacterium]
MPSDAAPMSEEEMFAAGGMRPPGMGPSTYSAETAVRNAIDAVQTGRLQYAYDFLPPNFQSDIDGVVHDFAERMDPELWEELFVTLQSGVKVLREQKDLILASMPNSDQPEQQEQQKQLAKNWDGIVDALEQAIDSDLSRLDKLKTIRTREFLAGTGNKLLAALRELSSAAGQNPIDQLSQTEIKMTASTGGETSIVSLKFPSDPYPQDIEFVLVEGRWIPKSLANSWTDTIHSSHERLESLTPKSIAAQKEPLMQTLGLLNGVFQQMLIAKTPEDLQAAAFPLILQGMQMASQFTPKQKGPSDGVMLIIEGEVDNETYTKLLNDLEQLSDQPDRATRTSSNSNGQMVIELRPVADPAAFAEKLTMGTNKEVDVSSRTIRMKWGSGQ